MSFMKIISDFLFKFFLIPEFIELFRKTSFSFFFQSNKASQVTRAQWMLLKVIGMTDNLVKLGKIALKVSESDSVVSDSFLPHRLQPTRFFCTWNSPFPSPRDLPNPGIKLWVSALQTDSLPPETSGKLLQLSIKLIEFQLHFNDILCTLRALSIRSMINVMQQLYVVYYR